MKNTIDRENYKTYPKVTPHNVFLSKEEFQSTKLSYDAIVKEAIKIADDILIRIHKGFYPAFSTKEVTFKNKTCIVKYCYQGYTVRVIKFPSYCFHNKNWEKKYMKNYSKTIGTQITKFTTKHINTKNNENNIG